jgi:hypothetical protein
MHAWKYHNKSLFYYIYLYVNTPGKRGVVSWKILQGRESNDSVLEIMRGVLSGDCTLKNFVGHSKDILVFARIREISSHWTVLIR